jgi:hypothetical protein
MITREDIVRKIAQSIYNKLERDGIPNTADGNWLYAERVVTCLECNEGIDKIDPSDLMMFRQLYMIMIFKQKRSVREC